MSAEIYTAGGAGETREPELGKSYKENKADNVMFVTAGGAATTESRMAVLELYLAPMYCLSTEHI